MPRRQRYAEFGRLTPEQRARQRRGKSQPKLSKNVVFMDGHVAPLEVPSEYAAGPHAPPCAMGDGTSSTTNTEPGRSALPLSPEIADVGPGFHMGVARPGWLSHARLPSTL